MQITNRKSKIKNIIICAIFLCAIAIVCHAEEQRWALLVGINQYADDTITPLKGAVNDTKALRNALIKYAGFPPDNVFCLTSDDRLNLPDLGNIVTKLEYIVSKMNPGDVLMFFFAGHGVTQKGKSYLLVYNTDIRSDLLLTKTGLSVEEELMGRLDNVQSGKIVLILDACRNDPGSGRGDVDNIMTDDFARAFRISRKEAGIAGDVELRATIYSCKTGERAFEVPGVERGFFSLAMEEAMSGKADKTGDKKVTLDEIDSYISGRVPDLIKQSLGSGKKQTPWVVRSGSGAGDWVFSQASDAPVDIFKSLPKPPKKSGLAAVSWSLLPGGGQFYNSRPIKGGVLGVLEIASIGALIKFHLDYSDAQDKYMSATKITDIKKYDDDASTLFKGRTVFSIVSAAILLYNVYDAYSDAQK